MKKYVFGFVTIAIVFMACSKEKNTTDCIKGKITYKGLSCHKKWGLQILEGPTIGNSYNGLDNVIEVYNIPDAVYGKYWNTGMMDTIQLKIRNTRSSDFEEFNNCPTKEAV